MKSIRKRVVFFTICCGLLVMNGNGVLAQPADNPSMVPDGSTPSLEMEEGSFVESMFGEIERISDGEISVSGMEFALSGDETLFDGGDNPLEIGMLNAGDEVELNYRISDKSVILIRLIKTADGAAALLEPSQNRLNSRKIKQLEDGTFTN